MVIIMLTFLVLLLYLRILVMHEREKKRIDSNENIPILPVNILNFCKAKVVGPSYGTHVRLMILT